jgi:hypothetical protein
VIVTNRDQWIEGNYCHDGYGETDNRGRPISGTGPKYYIGAVTKNTKTPIVAMGIVEIEGGWLLFVQDPVQTHRPDSDFCLQKYGNETTDLFEVMTIDTGWEDDVIGNALWGRDGMVTRIVRGPTNADEAKRALHHWVESLDLEWRECAI